MMDESQFRARYPWSEEKMSQGYHPHRSNSLRYPPSPGVNNPATRYSKVAYRFHCTTIRTSHWSEPGISPAGGHLIFCPGKTCHTYSLSCFRPEPWVCLPIVSYSLDWGTPRPSSRDVQSHLIQFGWFPVRNGDSSDPQPTSVHGWIVMS